METKKCVECETEIKSADQACPQCGAEQPIRWMIWLVYLLLGLFILGAIYRLFVP